MNERDDRQVGLGIAPTAKPNATGNNAMPPHGPQPEDMSDPENLEIAESKMGVVNAPSEEGGQYFPTEEPVDQEAGGSTNEDGINPSSHMRSTSSDGMDRYDGDENQSGSGLAARSDNAPGITAESWDKENTSTREALGQRVSPTVTTGGRRKRKARDPRIGRNLLGRYRLEELIGRGGMGCVYRAVQMPLDRMVAVKILNKEFQQKDPQFVRRFFLEAASAARLVHPNTITVFDYGEAESGDLFIAMEYLSGRPMSRVLSDEGPFPVPRVLSVGMQVCRALREAHSKGIIHRDLKPGNILLLDEGEGDFVKVLDFGLVKLFTPADAEGDPQPEVEELTRAGMFLGSPKYMSPEQAQGKAIDPRTDIYALGILMFQMVAGRPPFVGSSSIDTLYRHLNQPVPTFASLGVATTGELEMVIRKCLSKPREERYASMGDLLDALKNCHREYVGHSIVDPSLGGDLSQSGASMARWSGNRTQDFSGASQVAFSNMQGINSAVFSQSGVAIPAPPQSRNSGLFMILLVVVALLGGVSAVAGFLLFNKQSNSTQDNIVPATVKLEFVSHPPGAQVIYNGVSIGEAPFKRDFPSESTGSRVEIFTFQIAGYQDEIIETHVGRSSIVVRAVLKAEVKKKSGTKRSNEKGDEFLDNPY